MKSFIALAATASLAAASMSDKTEFTIVGADDALAGKVTGSGHSYTMVDKDGRFCFMLGTQVNTVGAPSTSWVYQWVGSIRDAAASDGYSEQLNCSFKFASNTTFASKFPFVQQSCGNKALSAQTSGKFNSSTRNNDTSCTVFEPVPDAATAAETGASNEFMRLFETESSKIAMKGGMKLTFDGAINVYSSTSKTSSLTGTNTIEITVADAATQVLQAGAMVSAIATLLAF